MKKKLLGTYLLLISLSIVISMIITWNRGNQYLTNTIRNDSIKQGYLLMDLLKEEKTFDSTKLQTFVKKYSEIINARITIIDKEGIVVADSHENYSVMDNHKTRDEVKAALNGEISTQIRFSKTLGQKYFYTAFPLELEWFNGILRLSMPMSEVDQLSLNVLEFIVVGIIVGACISVIIAYFITRKIMQPIHELTDAAMTIADGQYDKKIYIKSKDEIGKLSTAFNNMTVDLKITIWKLEQKNSQLESILRSMINGIVAVDEDYKILFYNEKFADILEIDDTPIKGKPIYEIVRNATINTLLEKSFEQQEYVFEESRSNEKFLRIYANPILPRNETNRCLGTLLVIQDITKVRKLENMRRDFVSNVSHELKTPLTSIRGFIDTLKHGAIKEEQVAVKFLDIIDIEAERLYLLIQDILTLSEIEAMKTDSKMSENNIEEIINEVTQMLEPKLQKKGLELKIEVASDIKPLMCDKFKIKQLLINLADNAFKYTEEGYIKISAKETFRTLVIQVEDTGIGIPKEQIPRIFERFYRVDSGRSRKMGGTGLGLSIVKHIVELYKGTVKVESEVGKGTTFIIKIPYINI